MICGYCQRRFHRAHGRGPVPLYCSAACRQAAHRRRHGIGEIRDVEAVARLIVAARAWRDAPHTESVCRELAAAVEALDVAASRP